MADGCAFHIYDCSITIDHTTIGYLNRIARIIFIIIMR